MPPRGGGAGRYAGKRTANSLSSPPELNLIPHQTPSSPESSAPEFPLSDATVRRSIPSSSSGLHTPTNEIGSTSSSNTAKDDRIPIKIVLGSLEPSNDVARGVTKIFKEKLDPEGYTWRKVSSEIKEFYWEEFKKRFQWDTAVEGAIKDKFLHKCADRYRSMLSEARSKEKNQENISSSIPSAIWASWKPHYETEAFKAKSAQCSKNRLSEKGGEGSGPSRHTGGSRTHREHARQMAKDLRRPPHPHELLKRTHTLKANKEEFVDQKSKNTYDAVMSKIASSSQTEDESSEPPPIDYSKIYLDEVGGIKTTGIYGLGSQAPFYGHVGASSSSTPRLQNLDFDAQVNESAGHRLEEMKEEMKQEMREALKEEMRQALREEMRQDMQLEVQEQVDQILQARLSGLVAGLPKPPTRTSQ